MKSNKSSNIVVAHPLQQHSYYTAEAFVSNDMLDSYITTVYYNSDDYVYKILAKILGHDNIKRMEGRQSKLLNRYANKYLELLGIFYLYIVRYDSNKLIEPIIYEILTNKFGKKIYKYCEKNKSKAVVMYDTTAYRCFSKLEKKQSKTIKILDMSSSAAPYIRKIILDELNSEDTFKNSLKVKLKSYSNRKCKKYMKELEYSDYFLVSSPFVEKGLTECGISKDKIIYAPYGVDTSKFKMLKKEPNKSKHIIKFIFVGRVEAAKGIYYILEAFRELSYLNIELVVVGSVECENKMIEKYKRNVDFVGVKSKNDMPQMYASADVYIMPSLWEGFSLTLFEAMASGLPIIASTNCGAEGIIKNYEHGFIVETGSIDAIKEKIIWFTENTELIYQMGKNANKLSSEYTWDAYKDKIVKKIESII